MTRTKLLTRDGRYVVTVLVPPFSPPVEIISCGGRCFIRQANGDYREGAVYATTEQSVQFRKQTPP